MFDRKEFLTVQETAKALGYFPPYVNKLIREGKIKAVKRGRCYFVSPEEINSFVGLPEPKEVEELL